MRVLFLGDIISRVGRKIISNNLAAFKDKLGVDLCIGNVENAAGIFGITDKVVCEISSGGVDVMTSGNHVWDKREGIPLLDERDDLLRPANFPPGVPGRGHLVTTVGGIDVAVINLQGRTFMNPIDCPFREADDILSELDSSVKIILVDFHAEATSEKLALGFYLDGRVSAVSGTHTHIQTADERILPAGTAYLTDVGMVGPFDSIIGVKKEQVIDRFLHGLPVRFKVAHDRPRLDAFLVEIDDVTGTALSVERYHKDVEERDE